MLYATPPLTTDDEAVLEALDVMRSQLRTHLKRPRRWVGTIRRQLKARAVRGSNSIEGIDISDDEAFAIVGGEDKEVAVDQTWLAVKGSVGQSARRCRAVLSTTPSTASAAVSWNRRLQVARPDLLGTS